MKTALMEEGVRIAVGAMLAGEGVTWAVGRQSMRSWAYRDLLDPLLRQPGVVKHAEKNRYIELVGGGWLQLISLEVISGASAMHSSVLVVQGAGDADPRALEQVTFIPTLPHAGGEPLTIEVSR